MSSDPNKKSARNFQCRDVLWETFEQMARELECSVDYLINEAMKQYARQRSYGSRTPFPGREGVQAPSPGPHGGYAVHPSPAPMQAVRGSSPAPHGPPVGGQPPGGRLPPPPMRGPQSNLPPPPARAGGSGHPMSNPALAPPAYPTRGGMQPPLAQSNRAVPTPAPRNAPPPVPRGGPVQPPMQGGMTMPIGGGMNGYPQGHAGATLSVIYQGDKLPVMKERFVIGRGKQSSDLTLKDPNVSRQHAMIEFQNGVYFMVDMGSTNGVEYNGQRIARKQIAEGDVFRICDHDLRFTYR
jgi:neural Wiskott-Aldrich syndrome protein